MATHPTTSFTPTIDTSDARHTVYDVPVLVSPQEPEKPLVDILLQMEQHISCTRFQLFINQVARSWPDSIESITLGWETYSSGEPVLVAGTHPINPKDINSSDSLSFMDAIDKSAFAGDSGFVGLINLLFEESTRVVQKTDLSGIINQALTPETLAKIFEGHLDEALPTTAKTPKTRF